MSREVTRNYDAYIESDHFQDAYDDPMRFLEPDMVPEVILDGRDYMSEGGPGKMRRKLEYDGVDAVLVIALDYPLLVTGWTEISSWARALASDRWSTEQLQKMRAFMDKDHKQEVWGR